MDTFCGSQFWKELTGPYFTPCFEKTVLAWAPCAFLWLFLSVELHYIATSKNRNIPRNWLNLTKLIGAVLCLATAIADFANAFILLNNGKADDVYTVNFTTPLVQLITYAIVCLLLEFNRRHGLRTSGLLFQFWFVASVCGAFRFRTFINSALYDETFEITLPFVTYLTAYPVIVIEFLLHFPVDQAPSHVQPPISKNTCPERQTSFVSRITFSWFDPMAWTGYKRPLESNDMWDLHPREKSATLVSRFEKHWHRTLRRRSAANNKQNKVPSASILPALFKAFGPSFYFGALLKFISDVTGFLNPIILQLLINFVWSSSPDWYGYIYSIVLFANVSFTTFILSQYFQRMFTVGLRIRSALIATIYKKALRLSSFSKKDTTVGEIVNLMSADAQKFMDLIVYVNMIWSNPLQFGLCFYLLWLKLGPSVLSGLAVLVLLIPVDAVIASRVRTQQIRQMKHKDQRVKLISEILAGIKVLKLNAWEQYFEERVQNIRNDEVKELKKSAYYDAANSFIWNFAPILVSLVSFATFVLSNENNVLDADTAFVSLTLFNMMRYSLTMFPVMITSLVQLSVAVKRINKFLNMEERDLTSITHDENEVAPIIVEDGVFSWGDGPVILQNINVRIEKGKLVAIVGTVGAGKSALLSAIIGDLNKQAGRVNTNGSIAYVPQQAWIQNASLKDNILFSKSLNQEFYKSVIDACALEPDIDILPAGDMTEIGEKGINLSGGQKQRVSLARAAYSERDVYLLDDPLSAVDSRVAKHLFEHVIGPNGILKDKTRILVTHNITNLSQVDQIIVMKDGQIIEIGGFNELISRQGTLHQLVQHHANDVREDDSLDNVTETEALTSMEPNLPKKKEEKLIEVEKSETGTVSWSIYMHYLRAVGMVLAIATLVFNIAQHATGVLSNVWLSYWSSKQTNTTEPLSPEVESYYLGIYGIIGAVQALFVLIPTVTLVIAGVRASVQLHATMLKHTLRNPIGFFDTTPAGRVVNRFAKDVDVIDNSLPVNIRTWLSSFLTVMSTLVVISLTNYFFLVFIVPIGALYYIIQRFYIPTSRQLKRIESVSRSPIYSHFGESLAGVSSIRAYACEERFEQESEARVDKNQMPYYLTIIANRWLAIRLEMLGNLIILFASLIAVIARETMSPGTVGLSISYALQITSTLNFLVRTTSDIETNIVAVERIKEYGETEEEAAWDIQDSKPRNDWPENGKIDFFNYQLRYREGLDLVLHDVTCSVRGGEKVGLVGRTGAGKSSLALGLFRIIESSAGSIMIDGVDISTLGLHDLRSRLTIIPQDPVLFSGSLRSNVDPLSLHDDVAVWRVLQLAHLDEAVRASPAGLDMTVSEGGEGLSVGQRQLVCLARALLRKTKVLILDEATGAVDLQTDDLVQKTIHEEFKDCTVLTIAHRLNTVMDSDRIFVLDQGRLIENGAPEELLNTPGSRFRALTKDAGLTQ